MKYLLILLLVIPFSLKGQDTIPAPPEQPIEVGEVYEFVVVVDSVVVDSVLTITKRMEKRKVMSDAEYDNLVRYHNRKIERSEQRITELQLDLELAEAEMVDQGESKALASVIQDEIDAIQERIQGHTDALAELEANEPARQILYDAEKAKKVQKLKDKKEKEEK